MIDPVVAKLKEVSAPLLAKIKTPPFKKTGDLKETVDSWMEYFEADVARSASTFDEYPELDFTPIGKAMLDKAKGLAPVPLQDKCKFQATMADLECAKASIVNLCIAIANVETTATAEEVFPHMAGTPINAPPQSFVSLRERTRGRRRSPPAEALGPIEPPTGPETEESIRERKNIPKWVLEKLGEPDAEGVYTVRHEPTILSQVVYFKQDSTSVWMWSFDKESWDSVSINVASRGKQVGQGLVGQGLDLLEALFKAEGGVVQPRSASFSFSNADAVPGAVHNCISHDSTGHAEPVLFIHGVTGTFGLSAASLETVVDIRRKRVKHYVVDRLVGGVDPLPSGITAYCGVAWKSPLPLKSPLIANKYHAWLNQAQGDGTVGSVPLAGMYGFATKNKPTSFDGSLPICKGLVSYQFPISKSKVPFAWHGHPSLRRPLMPGVDCSTKQHPMSCLAFWLFSSSLMPWGLKGGVAPGLMLLAISNADV